MWLTGLSAATGVEVNVAAVADKITKTGFELRINSGDGAPLGSVGAAWAVFSNVSNGRRRVIEVGSYNSSTPRLVTLFKRCKLSTNCPKNRIEMAAMCSVDLVLRRGLWVELYELLDEPPENPDLTIGIGAGSEDARGYSVGVGYALSTYAGENL